MIASDLPKRIFMLGTKESETKANFRAGKFVDGVYLTCLWTSQEKLDGWLAHRQKPTAHFEFDATLIFHIMIRFPAVRYVIVDPLDNEDPFDSPFVLESCPAGRRVDLHSFDETWSVLYRERLSPEAVKAIREYAAAHPALKPAELFDQFSGAVSHQESFVKKTGRDLQASGTFDQAKAFLTQMMKKRNASASNVDTVMEVWECLPELTLFEAIEFSSKMLQQTIGELKRTGEFDRAWCFTQVRFRNQSDGVLNIIRDVFDRNGHLTITDALDKASKSMNALVASYSDRIEAGSIATMSGSEFEVVVARLFEKMGFQVDSTKASHDGGIDLIAHCHVPLLQGKYIIQCKRYEGSVGEPFVRDLYGVMVSERANKGILVTNSTFTASAAAFAAGKPLELIDGAKLIALLTQNQIVRP